MSEPKVSERMAILVGNVGHTACAYGRDPGNQNILECSNAADRELLSAIAEIEQRAALCDKWKEAAVAIHNVCLDVSRPPTSDGFPAAVFRMRSAMAPLGPAWDEAVR